MPEVHLLDVGITKNYYNYEFGVSINNLLDDDYEQGVVSSIAHRMMIKSNKKVYTLGLDHRTAGFHSSVDNLPPSPEKIVNLVERIISCE
jgi:hypothetical protein